MSTCYLLDTNIISHMMRDAAGLASRNFAAATAANRDCAVVTSVVVECELRFGLERRPSARLATALDRILAGIDLLPIDSAVAPRYASLRAHLEQLGTPIGPNDCLIAAQALALDATLVSGDAEFARVPGLKLENWLI